MRSVGLIAVMSAAAAPAFAQEVAAPAGSPLMSALPLVAVFLVFFLLVIRPQQKQAKQRQLSLDALKKGDMVVTGGGAVGKVTKLVDDTVSVEIATGVEISLLRSTIMGLYVKPEPVKNIHDKKKIATKNDNLGVSKNKIANDN